MKSKLRRVLEVVEKAAFFETRGGNFASLPVSDNSKV
jgi:hypothetical protein